jgi:Ca2+-binding RTX toxin-like protein
VKYTDPAMHFGLDDDWIAGLGGDDHIYTGAGDDFLDGGTGMDMLSGGSGNDTIVAGAGNDSVHAGTGDDIYFGGSDNDTLDFTCLYQDDAIDELNSLYGVRVDLAVTGPQDLGAFGIDRILGFEDLRGGGGDDTFFGTSGVNNLNGEAGNDFLDGRGGDDAVAGGLGADTLIGGLGADQITTGDDQDRDIVRYLTLKDSLPNARDRIFGFVHGQDRIDLSPIDADPAVKGNQAFAFVKGFTKTAFGEVHLRFDNTGSFVDVDSNKDGKADMTIWVLGVHLAKADLIL